MGDLYTAGWEIANEAVDAFAELHSDLKMTLRQWMDLKEAIQREVDGRVEGRDISARDMLNDPA